MLGNKTREEKAWKKVGGGRREDGSMEEGEERLEAWRREV
jgi:hypothetical protein